MRRVVKEFQAPFVFPLTATLRDLSLFLYLLLFLTLSPCHFGVNPAVSGSRVGRAQEGGGVDLAVAYYTAKTFLISTPPPENVKRIATYVRPN